MNSIAQRHLSCHDSHDPTEQVLPGNLPLRALCWGFEFGPGTFPKPCSPKTLVLLHGLGDGADIWRPTVSKLASRLSSYSVIAFDLPGHGGSRELPSGTYSVGTLSAKVGSMLQTLSIDRPILIGHSLGASAALALAGANKIRPRGTILVDHNPDNNHGAEAAIAAHIDTLIAADGSLEDLVKSICERLPLADIETVRHVFAYMAHGSVDRCRLRLDPEIKQLLGQATASNEWELLQSTPSPIAIVRGQYSSVLARPIAERMSRMTRQPARLETIHRAGHAIPLEQPAALAAVLESLVGRIFP